MTAHATGASIASAVELDAARMLLARMGLSPADLLAAPQVRAPVPTFAEYIPLVSPPSPTAPAASTAPIGTASSSIGATGTSTNQPPRRSSSWSST